MVRFRTVLSSFGEKIKGFIQPRHHATDHQSDHSAGGVWASKRVKLAAPESYQMRWVNNQELDDMMSEYRQFCGTWSIICNTVQTCDTSDEINTLLEPLQSMLQDTRKEHALLRKETSVELRRTFLIVCKEVFRFLNYFYESTRIVKIRDNNRFVPRIMNEEYIKKHPEVISLVKTFMAGQTLPKVCNDILKFAKVGMVEISIPFLDRIVLDMFAVLDNIPPPSYVHGEEFRQKLLKVFPPVLRSDRIPSTHIPGSFPETDDEAQPTVPYQIYSERNTFQQVKKQSLESKSARLLSTTFRATKRRVSKTDFIQEDILRSEWAPLDPKELGPTKDLLPDLRHSFGHRDVLHEDEDDTWQGMERLSIASILKSRKKRSHKPEKRTTSNFSYPRAIRINASSQYRQSRLQQDTIPPKLSEFSFRLPGSLREHEEPPLPLEAPTAAGPSKEVSKHLTTASKNENISPEPVGGTKLGDKYEKEASITTTDSDHLERYHHVEKEAKYRILEKKELPLFSHAWQKPFPLPIRGAVSDPAAKIDELFALPSEKPLEISDSVKAGIALEKEQKAAIAAEKARKVAEAARKEAEHIAKVELEERLAQTGGLRVPKQKLVGLLAVTWKEQARDTLAADDSRKLATTGEGVELRRHDFATVVPSTEWLNDEIVNGSLNWLDQAVNSAAGIKDVKKQTRKCLSMSSFFLKRLQDQPSGTQRTLRRFGVTKDNILDVDTILVPICERSHWTLLVIRPPKKTIAHMDSLNPKGRAEYTNLGIAWMRDVLQEKFVDKEWKIIRHDAPLQTNGHDCGVHTITNGMCIALGLNPIDSYSAKDMPLQRIRIASTLLNGGFKGDFDLSEY